MMKRKRILSLLLAAALAVLAALPCSAAHYEPFEHPDVSFSDVVYTGVDRAAADALCARFARDPLGEYDALVALYDELYTQCELAYILLCENADDAAYSAAYEQAENDFDYASDRLFLALSEALDGPEGDALRAQMPEGEADAFSGYEAAGGDELAALSEETALMQEYYLLPDDDAFPEAAAELYLRLTALLRAQAEEAGFDSYSEYAYQAHYAREYGPGDIARLRETVRERLAPLYVRCVRALDERRPPWDDDDVPSGDEILAALAAHMGEVSPELTEAMDFLLRSGFFCVGSGDELYDGGFTTTLPAYGAPFLFNRVGTRFDAFQSTVHEFGHFNAAYHDPTPALYQYAGTDLSELQAQGLEIKVGDVIKVGDKIEVPAEGDGSWGINGNVLRNDWGPYTLIRADIYQASDFDDPVVTETEDGAFYVFKAENSDFYPLSYLGKSGGLVVTMTSDGLVVTAAENKEFTVAVHDKGDTPTAVENVQTNHVQATKILRDGQLLIEKDGKTYNVVGTVVR